MQLRRPEDGAPRRQRHATADGRHWDVIDLLRDPINLGLYETGL